MTRRPRGGSGRRPGVVEESPVGVLDPDARAAVADLGSPGVDELVDQPEAPPSDAPPGAFGRPQVRGAAALIADLDAHGGVAGAEAQLHRAATVTDGVGEQLAGHELQR